MNNRLEFIEFDILSYSLKSLKEIPLSMPWGWGHAGWGLNPYRSLEFEISFDMGSDPIQRLPEPLGEKHLVKNWQIIYSLCL